MVSSIPEILEDLRAGRPIILIDDEDRENEGDLVCAAEAVTPAIINFITRHTPGYLCVALTAADCDRLGSTPAVSNTALRGSDGRLGGRSLRHGVGTGISASISARTARLLADPPMRPDARAPGPHGAAPERDGGVLVRTGQTEGSVDLMRLAGLRPPPLSAKDLP